MNTNALLECFGATLSPDQQVRQHAESQLQQAATTLGFLGACLEIISANDSVPSPVKAAAAVFFKNRIKRNWDREEGGLDPDEKPYIRERILPALVNADHFLKRQLVPVLETIVSCDYPSQWPTLVDEALKLLYAGDLNSAYTGLLVFAKVASTYRWTRNAERPALDILINQHFPTLLSVADTLLKEDSLEAGEMTVLLLKTYKYVTYHDLPVPLQSLEAIQNWGNFHVAVLNKPLPADLANVEPNERKLYPWVKTKKWASANLYRLFERYGSQSLSKNFQYDSFKEIYGKEFVPQLLNLYLAQIDQWCSNQLWISEEQIYYILSFLEKSISEKHTWELLKPHIQLLVSHFVFKLLCPSDETLEMFEDDPEDYIHTKFDIFDDSNASDLAGISLLMTLTRKKKKSTLEPILQFAFGQLNDLKDPSTQSLEDAKKLEGSMRLVGALVEHLANEKSPYYAQMETLLQQFVLPHFESKFAFIKARTCDLISRFSDIPMQQEASLNCIYRGIMSCFEDSHLPVQLEAALAIQSFVRVPQFQEALSEVVVITMQKLLQLSNTIDVEAVSQVMQEIVEIFSEQLQPFGVDLMTNLVGQVMKLLHELHEAAKVDVDDFDGSYDDLMEKQMAALGLLNTMITVLLSFESSADIVFKLEETFYPVVEFVFVNSEEDFYREVCELIENSTFLTRQISPVAWKIFELIMQALVSSTAIIYLEDIMPALNNFLCFGSQQIKNNPQYAKALLELFKRVISDEEDSLDFYALGGEIAQKLVLTLGPNSEPYLPEILALTINSVVSMNDMSKIYAINMINVIVAGFVYHTKATLTALGNSKFLLPFFNMWFQYIPKLTRVFDMKLSILGILSLISLSVEELRHYQVETLAPQLGLNLSLLMYKIPDAINDLAKRRKEYESTGDELGEYVEYEDVDDEWVNEDEDDNDNGSVGSGYMQFLQQEAEKLKSTGFFDTDDDDLPEDPLAHDILEEINVFSTCKDVLLSSQSDAEKTQFVFGQLNDDQKSILKDIIDL